MKAEPFAPSAKERAIYEAVLAQAAAGVNPSTIKVQQIADAAGMGKGTLYEYFSSRDEILAGMVAYCLWREMDALTAAVQGAQDFSAMLAATADYVAGLVNDRCTAYRVVAAALQNTHEVCGKEQAGRLLARLAALHERGYQLAVAQGALAADADKSYYGSVLCGAMLGYATQLLQARKAGNTGEDAQQALRRDLLRHVTRALK